MNTDVSRGALTGRGRKAFAELIVPDPAQGRPAIDPLNI